MEFAQVGYFSKTHGIKGCLNLKSAVEFNIAETKTLFVETRGGTAPFFITEIKATNNGIIVCVENISNMNEAAALIGKKVYVDSQLLIETTSDNDWTGFELIDGVHGSLGKIDSVSDNGAQLLLTILYKGKEIILPVTEEFIEKIDETGQKIYYKAPDGLLDIYLS